MSCPRCQSRSTLKRNSRISPCYWTYYCRSCRRRFNERTGTPFNDLQFPADIVLMAVLWRLRYKLGFRDVAELLWKRGFKVSQLETLIIPEIDVATEAGRLIADIPGLWSGAQLEERHRLLRSAIDAVYIRSGSAPEIVRIQPKTGFEDLISIAPVPTS